ncbi:MAG TPA: GGDEF domain-containing protein, partial [Acidimicrobiales bacterium]|nr:GGDEF domain-containing protein [Acidimicrobiales bacterium]
MDPGNTLKKAFGAPISEPDNLHLMRACGSVVELFSASQASIWAYEAPAGGAPTGLVSFCAGVRWDGVDIQAGTRWSSVAVTDIPTFSAAVAGGLPASFEESHVPPGRQGELMSAFGMNSFDAEPIKIDGRTVGILVIDPPRIFDPDRAALLPVILEESASILAKLEVGRYREEARFLLTLLGRATARRDSEHVLNTICDELSRRLTCRHVTVFLADNWSTLLLNEDHKNQHLDRSANSIRYVPVISKRATGKRDLRSWKDFDVFEPELLDHLSAWAKSEVPLETTATGWWADIFGAAALLGSSVKVNGIALGLILVDTDTYHEFSKAESYLLYQVSILLAYLLSWATGSAHADTSKLPNGAPDGITELESPESARWLLSNDLVERRGPDEILDAVIAVLKTQFGVDTALAVVVSPDQMTGYGALPSVRESSVSGRASATDDLWLSSGFTQPNPNIDHRSSGDSPQNQGAFQGDSVPQMPVGTPVLRSSIAVPLGTGGKVWYVVVGGEKTTPRSWTAADLRHANRLAIEGSLRLEVARLEHVDRYQIQALAQRILRDPITSLPNSALLLDRIEQSMNRAQREQQALAIVAIDLDNFRNINETLGNEIGNSLLLQVAERLRSCLRNSDVVARVGGDGFAVLLTTSATSQGLQNVLDKITRVMSLPFTLNSEMVMVSAKLGTSWWPEHANEPAELVNAAFANLRSRQVAPDYPPLEVNIAPGPTASPADNAALQPEYRAPTEPALSEEDIVRDLQSALQNEEIFLDYLPKVSLASSDVTSMEALIRWNHPSYGLIPPSSFMPYIAESDLGWQVTEWVLNHALDQCKEWYMSGLSLSISINVSRHDILASPIIDAVADALERTKLLPRHLTIEISEQTVMDEMVRGSAALVLLRSQGVRISIDDCGSGKVAPLYLARMPVDEIKIDNGLLTAGDPDEAMLVHSIVRLGHEFGLEITAEAVEGSASAGGMERIGIDSIQGYHVAAPLRAENVPKWV